MDARTKLTKAQAKKRLALEKEWLRVDNETLDAARSLAAIIERRVLSRQDRIHKLLRVINPSQRRDP